MNKFEKLIRDGFVEIDTASKDNFERAIENSSLKLSKESVSEDDRFILIGMEDERDQVEMRRGMTYFYNPLMWRVKSLSKDKDSSTLSPREVLSRAEVLMAMDVIMKHLNDEVDQTGWRMDGVPDGAPPLRMTQNQVEYYEQFVDDFEDIVEVFARIVCGTCFNQAYEPRGFC